MEAALVSLTFDDGLICQFERAVPILDQHGLPATFFLIANRDRMHERRWPKIDWGDEDKRPLKGMIQRGHEIGSHSVSHGQVGGSNEDPSSYSTKTLRQKQLAPNAGLRTDWG